MKKLVLSLLLIVISCSLYAQSSDCLKAKGKYDILEPYYQILGKDTINRYANEDEIIKYGRWVYFRKTGYIKSTGYYFAGNKQGYWRFYDKKNNLVKIKKYRNNQLIEVNDIVNKKKKTYPFEPYNSAWDYGGDYTGEYLEMGNCN
ncbi:MAG: hypothetical protein V4667_09115 [Bacteroidota bacterium]